MEPEVRIALGDDARAEVCDSRGHQAGDRLLKEAAAAWRAVLRPGDMLARYGGEEFAVLLSTCDHALYAAKAAGRDRVVSA